MIAKLIRVFKEKNIPYKMITIGNLFDMDTSVEKLKILQKNVDNTQIGNYANLKTNNGIFEKLEAYEQSWHEMDIINALIEKIIPNKIKSNSSAKSIVKFTC